MKHQTKTETSVVKKCKQRVVDMFEKLRDSGCGEISMGLPFE